MFCLKCGNQIADNLKFCSNCGMLISSEAKNIIQNTAKLSLIETISIKTEPDEEQHTINTYQKFGWQLRGSQEINSSTTDVHSNANGTITSTNRHYNYVKLVFDRNKKMSNYNILNEKFVEFNNLESEKEKIKSETKKRYDKKSYTISGIVAGIIFLIALPISMQFAYTNEGFFETHMVFDWFLAIIMFFLSLCIGATIFGFSMAITSAVFGIKSKKELVPKIKNIEKQIEFVASEAEKYLY